MLPILQCLKEYSPFLLISFIPFAYTIKKRWNLFVKKYIPHLIFLSGILLVLLSLSKTSILNAIAPKTSKTCIVIDVGHGGTDPGKVSTNGTREKDINLKIALFLRDYLIAENYTVFLTRETDCGLYDESASNKKVSDLNNRIQFFKAKNADYVISIHQNSFPDASAHGAQTFYFTGSVEGKAFAESIQESLLKTDDTNTRLAKSSNSYYLLKHSTVPSIIVECGFLSNPAETAKLTDENYQKKIANAITLGINNYIKENGAAFY